MLEQASFEHRLARLEHTGSRRTLKTKCTKNKSTKITHLGALKLFLTYLRLPLKQLRLQLKTYNTASTCHRFQAVEAVTSEDWLTDKEICSAVLGSHKIYCYITLHPDQDFFSLLSSRASALWFCRLARLASWLAWLFGNKWTNVHDCFLS